MPYTELTRASKKLFLFLSPKNQLWSLITSYSGTPDRNHPNIRHISTQEDIAVMFDIAPTTFSHWKHSWSVGADSLYKILHALEILVNTGELEVKHNAGKSTRKYIVSETNLGKAKELFSRFKTAYEDNAVDVYSTAEMIDMKINECQQILDGLIYNKSPLFTGMYYDTDKTATDYMDTYGGLYFMWVKRGKRWLQCPMRIRYKLAINGLPAIRCKLNAPNLRRHGNDEYWEYDGFFAARHNRNYWIFEKRKNTELYDHFYCITGRGYNFIGMPPLGVGNANTLGTVATATGSDTASAPVIPAPPLTALTMRGKYLSTHQNLNQDIVNDIVFLQRQSCQSEKEEIQIMRSTVQILSIEDGAAIQKHYNDFNKHLDHKDDLM